MTSISQDTTWVWIEKLFSQSPAYFYLTVYFLFYILLAIYFFLDSKVISLNFSKHPDQLYLALISSSFIPLGLIGIRLLLNESKEIFLYLDGVFSKSQSGFYVFLAEGIVDSKKFMLLALSIGLPIVFLSWGGLPFHEKAPSNPFFLAVDIYNYFLLWLTICFLCTILWIQINASLTFHSASEDLRGRLLNYDIFILRRKLVSVRSYFLRSLIYFIIFISLINLSVLGLKFEINYSAVFLILLFIVGVSMATRGLRDTQRIIDEAAEENLEVIKNSLEENSNKLLSILMGPGVNKDEVERLQKIIELKEKEWDNIAHEKVGLDLKGFLREAGTFIISTLIPIISFLISPELRKVIMP